MALAIPLLGLALLLANPTWDAMWQHHPAHFWLVLVAALLSAVTAYGTGEAASRRGDARVMLVSLAFLSAAGFLALHALATPKVLLDGTNPGFNLATPVGIAIGSLFAAGSTGPIDGPRSVRAMRVARRLRVALVVVLLGWAVFSLLRLPPLDAGAGPERTSGFMVLLAVAATLLYAWSAAAYVVLWRRRRGLMPLAMAAAFVLLGEAMVAISLSANWHYSWWEWHLLMLAAFVLVAWGAQLQWHEERFSGLYLDETVSGTREMSILFADLQGFTTFSEDHEAEQVTSMLNDYFDVAVPAVVKRHGGEVDRIIGDALMVTFNRRGDQPDHALRAARAALELQEETGHVAAAHPGWPRFRVGVNSGPVALSLLGGAGGRTHTVIGDVVNVASRLEGRAPVGGVAVSAATLDLLPGARVVPLGALDLKGRAEPVEAFSLTSLPTH
ncbi:adenylate/guanylate cyclase domain-containing protein [Intrasporangium oryzae]|uniref:adenylate/guanylate cyclase domain-containing protein n=1 Tax=Intrasporangium oryzae TaxID=412687 RepID=UPI0012F75A2A|nr:adenylate/guanylate cyclase domain-containing protein [Intrasporangium oryzae]